jgi:sugar lactone lactonase YvrE
MNLMIGPARSLVSVAVIAALSACAQPAADTIVPSNLTMTHTVMGLESSRALALPSTTTTTPVYIAELCEQEGEPCSPVDGLVSQLQTRSMTDGVSNPVALAVDSSGNVYVSNRLNADDGNVTVYAANTGRLLRVLNGYKGVSYAIAFSPLGYLYVVSHHKYECCDIKGSVSVYAPGATRPYLWLSDIGSFPGKPAFDASGNYYQPNFYSFPGYISVYAPRAQVPFRVIQGLGFPIAVTLDASGQLYVLNNIFGGGSDVLVYAAGSNVLTTTIQTGVTNASAIALDSSGNLYVANRGEGSTPPSVTVYAPGTDVPARTIETGVHDPSALALDSAGNLYVASAPGKGPNTLTIYAPGAVAPEKTYRLPESPTALAIP